MPVAHASGCGLSICSKVVRLAVAQVLTVIRQTQKTVLREAYANKVRARRYRVAANCTTRSVVFTPAPSQKYLPLDLRKKQTRAIRRRLTNEQKNKKTEKSAKVARYFPLRRFAVKA